MSYVTFLDENLYTKKSKALRRYFMKCYKYLIFKAIPKLKEPGKKDGAYKVALPTEELFKRVYGEITLLFSVKNDVAVIEDITPDRILTACYTRDLPVYKGIPYETKKDLDKLKIMEGVLKNEL